MCKFRKNHICINGCILLDVSIIYSFELYVFLQTPLSLAFAPLVDLVKHLCLVSSDDVGRVWSFFVWIGVQDLTSHDLSHNPLEGSAIHLLLKARGDAATKNDLLFQMCK